MNDNLLWTVSVVLFFMLVSFVVGGGCGVTVGYEAGYHKGYVAACGDAHQGKLRCRLKENPDGTRTWEEKKKEEAKNEH